MQDRTLGACWDGRGTHFTLFSAHAQKVELCLFAGGAERRTALNRKQDLWHGYVPGAGPGTPYGYRVHGPYAPAAGHRFNPHKLLIDPYARALTGPVLWHEINHAYVGTDPDRPDVRDNAAVMPKSVVCAPIESAAPGPRRPWAETVIYELHVKGFTQLHPDVPEADRGTFRGLAAPAVIDYLTSLGVTAVELLPVFAFADEGHLAAAGLSNYWGYNTYNFFTPDPRYGSTADFQAMAAALHRAGIEVILDVVFNHTAEGSALGQSLSFRGIDNRSYYWAPDDDPGGYVDHSGCGNTLNVLHPRVRQLILDSLQYWTSLGVDGFRFDLATVLGRGPHGFHGDAMLLRDIAAALHHSKLIAEPWDVGSYHLGGFPAPWAEWNDRYRDTLRDFWRGADTRPGGLALRLAGSSDILARPARGVNFITAHDGFTLADLAAYEAKHNDANGEDNRDGTDHNRSRNWGAEGPTADPAILAARRAYQRNMLVSLLLSKGTPMLTAGDEFGRSQGGNNNAYCQDNPISWLDWTAADISLLAFTRKLLALRARLTGVRGDAFYRPAASDAAPDILWLHPAGGEITAADWNDPALTAFGFALPEGPLVLINGGDAIVFRLPDGGWTVTLDTGGGHGIAWGIASGDYPMPPLSLAVLDARR